MGSKSKAFEEFVVKRCEEILEDDNENKKINAQIISLEEQIIKCLGPQNINLLLQLDSLREKQVTNNYCKIYISAINDKCLF